MHVLQLSFFVDAERRPPERLLTDWHALADVARAAARAGPRVSVVQASMVEAHVARDRVDYHFIAPDAEGAPLTRSARFAALLGTLGADVYHVHGLGFAREVIGLRALVPHAPILVQDHAGGPARFWRRPQQRRGLEAASAVVFAARDQAAPFISAGVLDARKPVFEIPESTTTFAPGDRDGARAATGVRGDPAVLWVGHLDANKDPMTVLDAVALAAQELPALTLTCCFATAPLLRAVEARVAADARLRERVRLLGRVPRERVQELMRAADVFVLASHREGCNFSLLEALASGLPTAASDIPSSRALLGDAEAGAGVLWPRGDAHALVAALRDLSSRPRAVLRAQARARFEAEASEAALGRKLADAYERMLRSEDARRSV